MRVIILLILSLFMGAATAITKCEINGKISYQAAGCPEHAKAKYLIDDEYIDEERLRKLKQKKKYNIPANLPDATEEKLKQVPSSIESTDDQIPEEEVEEDEQEKEPVKNAPHVNVPRAFDYVNPKLSDMQQQIDEHKKELQKLENSQ